MTETVIGGVIATLFASVVVGLWILCERNRAGYMRLLPWIGGAIFAAISGGFVWYAANMTTRMAMLPAIDKIPDAMKLADSVLPSWWWLAGAVVFGQYVAWLPSLQQFLDAEAANSSDKEGGKKGGGDTPSDGS